MPAGARTFDGTGKTVIPGLIDTHAHLHYSGFELFPETKWEYVANLAYGVTTVYDPSAPSLDVFAQGEQVEAGVMVGPRIYSSGDVLYGGQQADIFAEVNNLDDAKHQVRRMKAYGARMIKVYQQPRRSQRIYFAEACRDEHMLLTAEGAGELQTDMTMAIDGFTAWEHALPVRLQKRHRRLRREVRDLLHADAARGLRRPLGRGVLLADAQRARRPEAQPLRAARHHRREVAAPPVDLAVRVPLPDGRGPGAAQVLRAGGNVSLGAHGQLQGLGPHWEIWAMAGEGGPTKDAAMTPMEALRASTILAADKIGFAPDLGSIEAGKLADFVVLDANPLDGHPQHGEDPLGRQERRGLGGRDDEEALAARGGAADVLLETRQQGERREIGSAGTCPSSFASPPVSLWPGSAPGDATISRPRPRRSRRSERIRASSPECPS